MTEDSELEFALIGTLDGRRALFTENGRFVWVPGNLTEEQYRAARKYAVSLGAASLEPEIEVLSIPDITGQGRIAIRAHDGHTVWVSKDATHEQMVVAQEEKQPPQEWQVVNGICVPAE